VSLVKRRHRALPRFLRSRHVVTWLAVTVAATSLLRIVAGLLVDTLAESPEVSATLGMYAVMIAVSSAGPGLSGSDIDLDRAAAVDWRPIRLVHVLFIGAVVALIVGATALTGHTLGPTQQIVRNSIGFTGLLALAATTLGVARSWIPPLLLAVLGPFVVFAFDGSPPRWTSVVTWPIQFSLSTDAWLVATAFAVVGTAAYTVVGPRP
jgi:hypothetical protein